MCARTLVLLKAVAFSIRSASVGGTGVTISIKKLYIKMSQHNKSYYSYIPTVITTDTLLLSELFPKLF